MTDKEVKYNSDMFKADKKGFVTLKEDSEFNDLRGAAAYAHVGRQALYLAISKGALKAKKKGLRWTVCVSDMDDYITNKYNRDNRKVDGELLFDMDKGFFSVFHVSKILSRELGYHYKSQRIYYLIQHGRIKAMKKGSAWVIAKEDWTLLLNKELVARRFAEKEAD